MSHRIRSLTAVAFLALLLGNGCRADNASTPPNPPIPSDSAAPHLTRTVWLSGLNRPWDIGFLPNGDALVNERIGRLSIRRASNTAGTLETVAQIPDAVTSGEGGLLGLAIDPEFSTNRFIYTCLTSNRGGTNDNRVVRWRLADNGLSLEARTDIVTGLPWTSSSRHLGCRTRFGPDGMLWIGTGDAATGVNPQLLTSLGGKVLRVTRDGSPAPGNPTIIVNGVTADPRIYTYGHRNVQGVAVRPSDGAMFAVEQGPAFDDEVTQLRAGANGGWNPVPGYNESVSMTDLTAYPDAMRPVWQSGAPARGTSGGTFITGAAWGSWNGAFAITQLVGAKMVVLTFNADGSLKTATNVFEDQNTRLRVPVMGPDGAMYIATDVDQNGGAIWRVTPTP